MPADNSRLTTQKAFYVPISRVRNRAGPVADGARKRADQLQGAAVECVAALDGLARRPRTRRRSGSGAVRNARSAPHRGLPNTATMLGVVHHRNAAADPIPARTPAATATETCLNKMPGTTGTAGSSATTSSRLSTAGIVRTDGRAKPGRKSDAAGAEAGRTRPPNCSHAARLRARATISDCTSDWPPVLNCAEPASVRVLWTGLRRFWRAASSQGSAAA